MLEVASSEKLEAMEAALRRAARRHEASVLAVTHIGQLLRQKEPAPSADDAIVFTVCHPELYAALLAEDIRWSAFLPCRVAVCLHDGRVSLEAVSPIEFCRTLNRPDLVQLAGPLETVLLRIMEDAAQPLAAAAQAAPAARRGGLGATEEQMNVRASIPQRIDCRGTKVEEIAGTGQHDSQGG